MTDALTPQRRSENMRRIKSKDMKPELLVRSIVHRMGYRFRLHRKDLPGKPDLVLPSRKKAIFVHGCFWHQHKACREGRMPGSRRDYWVPKLQRNVERDAHNSELLKAKGWSVLTIWECEVKDEASVKRMLTDFLMSERHEHHG